MDTIAVLFNPSSGRGRSLKRRAEIEARFQHHGISSRWFVSQSEEHLKELVRDLIKSYPVVVTVGGDTTFTLAAAEVVNVSSDVSLGMVGAGSANDISRGLGHYDLEALCGALISGSRRRMDALQLEIADCPESIIFMGALSLGLGVEVNRYIAQARERHPILKRGGSTVQALTGAAAIRHAFSQKSVPSQVWLENQGIFDRCSVSFSLMIFANTPYYANGLKVFPDLSPFDGFVNCGIFHSTSFLNTFKVASRISSQRHLQSPELEILAGTSFHVAPDEPLDLQYDGEILAGTKGFTVRVLPAAVSVVMAE
jgi:diacylglycerol kinase (ATP)